MTVQSPDEPPPDTGSTAPDAGVTVTNAGATSVHGNVTIRAGRDAAGRDLVRNEVYADTVVLTGDRAVLESIAARAAVARESPYPGLAPFGREQAATFHGRSRDVERVVELVDDGGGLVALVGSSGSGKSSLLAAGVVPMLTDPQRPRRWHAVTVRLGSHPLRHLAEWLARAGGQSDGAVPEVARSLLEEPMTLVDRLHQAQDKVGAPLLLVLDQFEEVFAPGVPDDERAAVLLALAAVRPASRLASPRVCAVVALRSDFYPQLAGVRAFAEAVAARQHYLAALDDDAVREVVQRPAEQAGLRIEADLVERIVDDVRSSGSALPFLAAALLGTWRQRQGNRLTTTAYLAAGGVTGALEKRADDAWAGLHERLRDPARRLLLRLVHAGTEATAAAGPVAPSRRRRSLAELVTDADDLATVGEVVRSLADAQLVTVEVDARRGEPVVEIVHDALLTGWKVMREWLEADRGLKVLQDDLAAGTSTWLSHGRDAAYLYGGARLGALQEAHRAGRLTLNGDERAFVAAAARTAAAQRRRSRLLVVLPVLLVVALVVATLTWRQQRATAEAKELSDALQLAAQARAVARSDAGLGALLASAAYTVVPTRDTWGALVDALGARDAPVAFLRPAGVVTNAVTAVDGAVFAGGADGLVRRLALPRGGVTATLEGHDAAVSALAGQGGLVVSGDVGGTVLVHDARSGRRIARFDAGSQVNAVAVDAARRAVAAIDADGAVHRWPMKGLGGTAQPLALAAADVVAAADGRFVVATRVGGLVTLPSAGGGPTTMAAPGTVRGAAPHLAAGPGGTVVGLSLDGVVLAPVDGQGEPRALAVSQASALAVGADGRTLLVGTTAGTASRWGLADRASPTGGDTFGGSLAPITEVAVGGSWASALNDAGGLVVWDLDRADAPGAESLMVSGDRPDAVAYGRTGRLAVGFASGRLGVVDRGPSGLVLRSSVDLGEAGVAVGVGWRGDEVVAGTDSGAVVHWRPGERSVGTLVGGTSAVTAMSASREGVVAVGRQDGSVQLVRGAATEVVVPPGSRAVTALALSPDGTGLAVASGDLDATRLVVRRLTGESSSPVDLPGARLFVASVAFTPDGATLVAGSDDRQVRFYDATSGRLLGEGPGHAETVRAVAVSPDGATLASADDDGVTLLWDVGERRRLGGALVQGSATSAATVRGLSASPDGSALAVAGLIVRTWPLAPAAWRARACSYAGRDLSPDERAAYSPGRSLPRLCA